MAKAKKISRPTNSTDIVAILSMLVGILIILWPDVLAIAIGIYLIIIGILRLVKK